MHMNRKLIHCITNPAFMNDMVNTILALGDIPIMANEIEEICEISKIADGYVINMWLMSDRKKCLLKKI